MKHRAAFLTTVILRLELFTISKQKRNPSDYEMDFGNSQILICNPIFIFFLNLLLTVRYRKCSLTVLDTSLEILVHCVRFEIAQRLVRSLHPLPHPLSPPPPPKLLYTAYNDKGNHQANTFMKYETFIQSATDRTCLFLLVPVRIYFKHFFLGLLYFIWIFMILVGKCKYCKQPCLLIHSTSFLQHNRRNILYCNINFVNKQNKSLKSLLKIMAQQLLFMSLFQAFCTATLKVSYNKKCHSLIFEMLSGLHRITVFFYFLFPLLIVKRCVKKK